VGELLLELGIQGFLGLSESTYRPRPALAFLGYTLLGALIGGASLLVFPELFIRTPKWRLVNLIATPILAGMALVAVGQLRLRRGGDMIRLDRFWYAFAFAFAMALVRFFFADR
jgi:hypothetical protein